MEIQKSLRYRVSVSISTKGQETWDCTVDFDESTPENGVSSVSAKYLTEAQKTMADILSLSDDLVRELKKRYPITEVK